MKRVAQSSARRKDPTSSLKRAFTVLSQLPCEQGLHLAEIAQRTSLPKPTTHRILQVLIELGQVLKDEQSKLYCSTGRVSIAASSSLDALLAAARPAMSALHRRLNETINLGILAGDRIRYVHVLETTRPLRLMTTPDSAGPLHCTALGRAIISTLDAVKRNDLIGKLRLTRCTERTITDALELERIVIAAQRRGYAEEREENNLGVACLAVPLRGALWAGKAAISVTIPTARYSSERRNEIIAALKEIVP
jgi:DNA-binding IclR family transcriptional regulator